MRLSHIRLNEFSQIPGTASPPRGPQKQSGRLCCKQKEKPSQPVVWAAILCVQSAPLPDSVLVSSDPGSKLTPDEPQKNSGCLL